MRGHVESTDGENNPGNFLALLKFRADAGDEVLANHLSQATNRAKCTSPTIQNVPLFKVWSEDKLNKKFVVAENFAELV